VWANCAEIAAVTQVLAMAALGRKRLLPTLSFEVPLSGGKRLFKSLDFRHLNGRLRPGAAVREIGKTSSQDGLFKENHHPSDWLQ